MSGQVDDQHEQSFLLDAIDHSILASQSGRTVSFPIATERLVIKSPNEPQPGRTRDLNDVLPFFVPLENVFRRFPNLALNVAMLENLPHILYSVYISISMSIGKLA